MLTLRTFKPFRGTMAASSFALKADALLAMSGLPYEREHSMPQKQPLRKLPVLVDGDLTIPDSALIQRHLETAHGVDFDSALNATDRAQATALRRLVEEHLYFLGGHFRWTQHPGVIQDEFMGEVPKPIRGFVFRMVDKGRAKALDGQGLGRRDDARLRVLVKEDVDAIAAMLGDTDFLFGDSPTGIDASVWGCIHSSLRCELDSPLKTEMQRHANLVTYEARFRERFYGNA